MERRSLRGPRALMILSCVGFGVGLYFPFLILLDPGPSVAAYLVVLVSFPSWAVGAVSGGTAGYLLWRADRAAPGLRRFSWFISGLNALAVIACAVWSPAGIS